MACGKNVTQPQNYVPVCASVLCEAPGVIYVSVDPDVWKIRCRQCQQKTEHKCALKKLKNKFRGDPSKRRQVKDKDKEGEEDEDEDEDGMRRKKKLGGADDDEDGMYSLEPAEQIPDDMCPCRDRPKNVPPKPYVCLCELYKPLNFMFEMEVTGEYKPAFVPKVKKGKSTN